LVALHHADFESTSVCWKANDLCHVAARRGAGGRVTADRLTRRQFVAGVAAAAVAALAAGCSPTQASPPPTTAPPSLPPSRPASAPPSPSPSPAGSGLTLRQRIAALLVVGFRGLEVSADDPIVKAIRDEGLGGVILFDRDQQTGEARNIVSPDQLRDLTAALREAAVRPLWIAVDQEGGRVARLGPQNGFFPTLSQAEIEGADPTEARQIAIATAATLDSMGIDLNLAPVVDLNVNPDNPSIGALGRSFSADPDVVVNLADAVIRGHHDKGVLTCIKHFPGLGSATGDTDRGFVDVTETWTPRELEPFAQLVASRVTDTVMVANALNRNLDPDLPSTLSAATVALLRSDLGWDGVVITDDLQAGALSAAYDDEEIVSLALEAGNDVLLFANQQVYVPDVVTRTIDTVVRLVEAGQIDEGRIDASVARVEALRART
jgi:beta-N-acetylhexosaminidase